LRETKSYEVGGGNFFAAISGGGRGHGDLPEQPREPCAEAGASPKAPSMVCRFQRPKDVLAGMVQKSIFVIERRCKIRKVNCIKQKMNPAVEMLLTKIAIGATSLLGSLLIFEIVSILITGLYGKNYRLAVEESLFLPIVSFFIYGNLVYQFTRVGYMKRLLTHCPVASEELGPIYDKPAPALAILVPSYREEPRIIKETLLSAALQAYPNRRVVLLIDDPPSPDIPHDLYALSVARRLPHDIKELLEQPKNKLKAELAGLDERKEHGFAISDEYLRLADLYDEVAAWFQKQASAFAVTDHTDEWFVKKILLEPALVYSQRAEELLDLAKKGIYPIGEAMLLREYRKLLSLFDAELDSFERKMFENLSHESNKAMNLNSYIGIMGKSFREVRKDGRLCLEPTKPDGAEFSVPDADYLITLDADSLLMPDYAIRLIHVMAQPGNERIGVAQTPYSAIPHPPGVLERVAGATTDIQYIIHQGFTHYNATFWVGANALLRKAALEDICTTSDESGFRIKRYIQDRTVIEDTESSIDLIDRGWTLFNYPDRLSYSATPPDFGSLLIQRRRWANGGLIILPKLMRYIFRDKMVHERLSEGLHRFHYLTSITGLNMGLLLILLYPFELNMRSGVWLSSLFFANYLIYSRDLLQSGYKFTDLIRVYAFTLMLVPINLGGVFKSLHQAWTGQRISFKRTPKVSGRTATPRLYIIAEFALFLVSIIRAVVYSLSAKWVPLSFALLNSAIFLYILTAFMGLYPSKEDLQGWWAGTRPRPNFIKRASRVPTGGPTFWNG
jgi:cellulose synthase (UDP-forming)